MDELGGPADMARKDPQCESAEAESGTEEPPSTSAQIMDDGAESLGLQAQCDAEQSQGSVDTEILVSTSCLPNSIKISFDPVVTHTIALMQYRRRMKTMNFLALGPIPEQVEEKPPLLNSLDDSAQCLADDVAEKILRRSISLIAAHIGFTEIEDYVVNLLSRITASRLEKTWKIMRVCDERRQTGRDAAFQTLRILKIEDVKDIGDFYSRRIAMRRNSLLALCEKEREQFLESNKDDRKRKTCRGSAEDGIEEADVFNAKKVKTS